MPTIVERDEPLTLTSMDDVRAAMTNPDEVSPENEEAEELPEAGTGAEPEVAKLPKGVQKKLEEEASLQADYDRQIAIAVSARKAKEHELAKLTTNTGTDPVKTEKVEKKADGPPEFPDFETFEGTGPEFRAALAKAQADFQTWQQTHTRESVQAELAEERAREARQSRWDGAAKEHGAEAWKAAADTLVAQTPVTMQFAISALDNMSKVAMYLAGKPDEMKALADQFTADPVKAAIKLGRLEEKITAVPAKTAAPAIPKPLGKQEAGDGASGEFDWDSATMSQKRAYMQRAKML